MQEIEYIEHDGIVTSVDPAARLVEVRITDKAECSGCAASALCGGAKGAQTFRVKTADPAQWRPGERVTLRGTERLHRKAIMIATVIPSIALVGVMVAVYILTLNQLAACLSGLATMILFFAGLWFMRGHIAHEFEFTLLHAAEDHPSSAG